MPIDAQLAAAAITYLRALLGGGRQTYAPRATERPLLTLEYRA